MARKQHDFDDREEQEVQAPAPDEERAVLAARIAELEAQLATSRRGAEALSADLARERTAKVVDAPVYLGADYWRVKLQDGPEHVVRAQDAANAAVAFYREMGIISSAHVPSAAPATREEYHAAQAKRHGVRPAEYRLPD